jgi:hypothetical protein
MAKLYQAGIAAIWLGEIEITFLNPPDVRKRFTMIGFGQRPE